MSVSEIISLVCAVLGLLATIIIAVVQYFQGKRMEELSLKQDKEQKRATAQRIKAERDSFIMKYYNDNDEIYMLPLCWISSVFDPAHSYHRKMYMEYNMLEEDVQDAICQYMHFEIIKPNNDRETFYKDCVDALKKAEFKNYVGKQHKSIYYENAKYLRRAFEYYGNKKLPIDLFVLENRLTDLLRDYREKTKECPDPIEQFLEEFDFHGSDEVQACEVMAVLSKWLAEVEIDIYEERYWVPGSYGREQITTMEDLFLCALLCIYLCLIMPKKKGNNDE